MDTYDNLKTEVVSWLNREGFASLVAQVDTFLGMAQRRVFRTCDFRCLEESTTDTTATLTLPADYQRSKALFLSIGSTQAEVTGGSYHNLLNLMGGSPRCPVKYAIQGGSLVLAPTPDQEYDYTLLYYKSLPLLSDSNTTNWFTDNAPELLLFGSLVEACLFLKDDNRAQVWQARFDQTKEDIQTSDDRQDKEYGGMAVRLA